MLANSSMGEGLFGALRANEQERAADADTARRVPQTRIRATGLVAKPWWLPIFGGLDP
ncbi:hypothetical protein [Kitasatospora indigofera]|uniref:hypothetical protein n=1 Tax=Kitasatospora indigofera TaxID=67307 RepID=UPI0033A8D1C2